MGYIITIILGILIVGVLVIALGRGRSVGQVPPRGRDVTVKQPAAAEPTPPRSDTAPAGRVENATHHTPPA
jgi:hypothetical protein